MPRRVYDHDEQRWRDMADEELDDGLRSGRYVLPRGESINILSKSGQPLAVDAENAYDVLNSERATVETAAQEAQRIEKQEYGTSVGSELIAAMLGGASGATLGATEFLTARTDDVFGTELIDEYNKYRRHNPGVYLGANIAGSIAPIALSGGLGLLASGARLAPAARATMLAAKGGGALAKHLARRGVSATTAGAIGRGAAVAGEGAIFGASTALSEDSLGDEELTAEKLFLYAGGGAGLGLGAVAGIKGASMLAKGAVKMAPRMAAGTHKAIESLYAKQFGAMPAKGLARAWAKFSSAVSGGDELAIKEFLPGSPRSARMLQIVDRKATILKERADALRVSGQAMQNSMEATTPLVLGEAKFKRLTEILPKETHIQDFSAGAALKVIDDTVRTIDGMLAEGTGVYEFAKVLKDMRKVAAHAGSKITKAIGANRNIGATAFESLDILKRHVGFVAKRHADKRLAPAARATIDALVGADLKGGLYHGLRNVLEDESLWAQGAVMQRELNKRWHGWLRFENYHGRKKFFERFDQDGMRDLYEANPKAFTGFVDNWKHGVDDLDYKYLSESAARKKEFLASVKKHYNLAPDELATLNDGVKASEVMSTTLKESLEEITVINQLDDIEKTPALFNALSGITAGYIVGDQEGAAVGALLGSAFRPGQTIRQLAAIERMTGGITSKIGVAAKAITKTSSQKSRVKETAKALGRAALVPATVKTASYAEGRRRTREKDRATAAVNRINEISELAGSMTESTERLNNKLDPFYDVIPNIAGRLAGKTVVGVQFLNSKAPQPPPSVRFSLTPKKWRPSEAEIMKFERYLNTVDNPLSVLASLQQNTVSDEQIETLTVVYPKLYEEMRNIVQDELIGVDQDIPYAARAALAKFLQRPIDVTTTPAFTLTALDVHAAASAKQGAQQPGPQKKKKSAKPRKLSRKTGEVTSVHQTQSQRLESPSP